MCVNVSLRYLYFNIGLPTRFGQRWSTSKSNISNKLIVPKYLAQILKKKVISDFRVGLMDWLFGRLVGWRSRAHFNNGKWSLGTK